MEFIVKDKVEGVDQLIYVHCVFDMMFRLTPSSYPILTVKARMAHVSGSVDTEKRQLVYLANTDLVNKSLEGMNSTVACKVQKAGIIEVTFLLLYLS